MSDPRTHPDWWPEVIAVSAPESLDEGDEYLHTSKLMPFVDAVDAIWVAERIEHLKEARFRLSPPGSHRGAYVEVETGIDPVTLRWRVAKPMLRPFYKRWIIDVLDALPGAIRARA